MARVLKITIVLVICLISLECRKDKVFCEICGNGLKANGRRYVHSFARLVVHEGGHAKPRWGSV